MFKQVRISGERTRHLKVPHAEFLTIDLASPAFGIDVKICSNRMNHSAKPQKELPVGCLATLITHQHQRLENRHHEEEM